MTQTVNVGTTPNDGTGDTLRGGMVKLNNRLEEIEQFGLANLPLAYNDRGSWAAATAYAFNDMVKVSSIPYLCVTSHTSSALFATDLDANKWVIAGYDALSPRPVVLGGTGADNAGDALTNLGLVNINATLELNGATTMTSSYLGKVINLVDSGTPADYTVTLPSGAPLNSFVAIYIDPAATKWFTIAGSDVGIDGVASRGMWRGEMVMLVRKSGSWTKFARIANPLCGVLTRTASQTFSGTGWTKVAMTSEVGDSSFLNLCFDSANGRLVARRACQMTIIANLSIAATCSAAGVVNAALSRSGAGIPTINPSGYWEHTYAVGRAREIAFVCGVYGLSTNNYVELLGRLPSGTYSAQAFEFVAGTLAPTLSYTETPLW